MTHPDPFGARAAAVGVDAREPPVLQVVVRELRMVRDVREVLEDLHGDDLLEVGVGQQVGHAHIRAREEPPKDVNRLGALQIRGNLRAADAATITFQRCKGGKTMRDTILVNRGTCYACAVACKRWTC